MHIHIASKVAGRGRDIRVVPNWSQPKSESLVFPQPSWVTWKHTELVNDLPAGVLPASHSCAKRSSRHIEPFSSMGREVQQPEASKGERLA